MLYLHLKITKNEKPEDAWWTSNVTKSVKGQIKEKVFSFEIMIQEKHT